MRKPSVIPRFPFILLAYFTLLSSSISAAQLQVVTEHREPLNFVNDKGEIVGDATRVVKQILEHAAVDYELNIYPWARAYRKAKTEPNTLIYAIRRTNEREKEFHWVCPIIPSEREFIYRLSSRQDVQLVYFEDAKFYSLGVVRDDFTHEKLVTHGFKHLDVNNDSLANLKKLLKGRVDLIVQSDSTITRHLAALDIPQSRVTAALPFELEQPTCLALNKHTSKELVDKIRTSHSKLFKLGLIPMG